MKVAIGYRLQEGPWGGGNQFARSLAETLQCRGDVVRFDLADSDVDIIVLTDPRARSSSVSFGAGAVLRYLLLKNPRALVVHRINECDERKGTRRMNLMLRHANYCADHTVFIASWLKDLDVWERDTPSSVILNGADERIFNRSLYTRWHGHGPLRLVTHHWGGNRMKGFDIYEILDRLLTQDEWKKQIEFTYIGNLPAGFSFTNARYLLPMHGDALARELSSHHAYVTASVNEPAGMHHIEGAMCGLPLLYRRSGALPEYCDGFGIGFDGADFVAALRQMLVQYASYAEQMASYSHTAEHMCDEYIALFDEMLAQRNAILGGRRLWRNPWLVLRNQIPL
jgi:glycosyltransferase involved in cell wall biosynthesis